MRDEIWKPLTGTRYMVSSTGRVRRYMDLRPGLSKLGYLRVGFRRGTSYNHKKLVHVLVAEAFFGPKPEGMVVNHKNGDKADNRVENLEYVTPQENAAHAAATGLYLSGERHPKSKLTAKQILTARRMYRTGRYTFSELALEFGVSKSTINKAVNGDTYASCARP